MNEEMKLLLEAVQLIVRDRTWNNQNFEVQSKITDSNISKLLNPIKEPSIAERTHDAFCENTIGRDSE
jgi:hypothetical protein